MTGHAGAGESRAQIGSLLDPAPLDGSRRTEVISSDWAPDKERTSDKRKIRTKSVRISAGRIKSSILPIVPRGRERVQSFLRSRRKAVAQTSETERESEDSSSSPEKSCHLQLAR